MTFVGLNRFVLIFRINHLHDYSKNFFEIFDIKNIEDKIIKYAAALTVRPYTDTYGKSINHINAYNYLVVNQNYELEIIDELFIPNNKQIIILLHKNIKFLENDKTISEEILKYVKLRIPEFYKVISNGLYNNLKYDNYIFNQFEFLLNSSSSESSLSNLSELSLNAL